MAYLEWEGMEHLVREYVDGVSLHELVTAQGPLAPDKVRAAALSLCQVLGYLHSQNPSVICRDVKPQNVVLDPSGCCHLIDLGAARRPPAGAAGGHRVPWNPRSLLRQNNSAISRRISVLTFTAWVS